MWIVRLALRRPYTFVVAAMLVVILFFVTLAHMPTDIFPDVDIPVISVIFNYSGMSPDDMEKRMVGNFERFLTTTVNDIEHIESQSLYGVGVIKIYFQKGAKIEAATAQVTAVAQTAIRQMPPGSQPPLVIRYSASNVPILQLSFSSDRMSEQQLFDTAVNVVRTQLVTINGVQIPYPYGGKQRQIMVDLDPEKLYAWSISPQDVSDAITAQNLILPAGTTKIGMQEYPIKLNSSPELPEMIDQMPIKTVHGTTVYVHDVAHVRDGFSVQTNVVHSEGKRGVLLSILKSGNSSTLDVVNAVRDALPRIRTLVPTDLKITPLFDQSVFVRAAVQGVVKEALIAAGLTGLMILLFLGSWRSTVIVMISIPLSIFVSIIVLAFLGNSLNVMTLGGLALAVGILVDDATVEIENIHRNLHQRKRLVQAILDGASQIAVPAFVSTLCICIVFVPVMFISGAAKFLFTPLAMAVVFAMMTSYLLSRTLVPTMVHYLLAAEVERYGGEVDPNDPHAAKVRAAHDAEEHAPHPRGLAGLLHRKSVRLILMLVAAVAVVTICTAVGWAPSAMTAWLKGFAQATKEWMEHDPGQAWGTLLLIAGLIVLLVVALRYRLFARIHVTFNNGFEKLRRFYGGVLVWSLEHRAAVVVGFTALVVVSCGLFLLVGTDFFPSVDAGQIRLHVRAPAGTRIEETERYFAQVAQAIRKDIPADEIDTLIDNIGIPYSGINLSLSDGTMSSAAEGEVLVSLKEGHHPTPGYVRTLRKDLPKSLPDLVFYFQPPDIATQVLNFGLSAPIDVQIVGPITNQPADGVIAQKMMADFATIPGVVDLRIRQVNSVPEIKVDVDRTLADQVGLTQRDVAGNLLVSLSSNGQTSPNFWLNTKNGVSYNVMVQTPQYRLDTINDLTNTPIPVNTAGASHMQLLGNLAALGRDTTPANITHYNTYPTVDVQMGVQGIDLGRAAKGVEKIVDRYRKDLPRGSNMTLRGQVESMHDSFVGLGYGLIFAVVLVYLLMVINFQSWLDPLIILMALPGALAGILWMLYATGTTISVPALMGAIMSIGVATANSILMITFANDQRLEGKNAHDAALAAGLTRLRPVIMTAVAMIIGMLPMSLGLGEGGEQNAPLGRAVIGGLLMATFATLIFVPVVYSLLRQKAPETQVEEELR